MASEGDRLVIIRITEEGEAADGLLQFCYENALKPGRKMLVNNSGSGSVEVELEGEKKLLVPAAYAEFICCAARNNFV